MTHPNNMTGWDTIQCQRGCNPHYTRWVDINLNHHGYADLTDIPARFQHRFTMSVWDPKMHPVDGGAYCPAHDAVSETLTTHGVWEPRETVTALLCLEAFPGIMIDMGSQLGWYTVLAALGGREVLAYEADPDNVDIMWETVELNGIPRHLVTVNHGRIGRDTPVINPEVSFAKIDLEGAEADGVRVLWPAIETGRVGSLMVEVSPVFDTYYPQLVVDIMAAGYDARMMPAKHHPPHQIRRLADLPRLSGSTTQVMRTVARWHQEDVLFVRRDS